jgi:hypothetical protein
MNTIFFKLEFQYQQTRARKSKAPQVRGDVVAFKAYQN